MTSPVKATTHVSTMATNCRKQGKTRMGLTYSDHGPCSLKPPGGLATNGLPPPRDFKFYHATASIHKSVISHPQLQAESRNHSLLFYITAVSLFIPFKLNSRLLHTSLKILHADSTGHPQISKPCHLCFSRRHPFPTYCMLILVVIGCGHTAVKIFMRLWLQNFVSPVYPQPLARVMSTV